MDAVPKAMPTPYADPLIRTWASFGVEFAITTNNAAVTAAAYFEGRGLADCFPYVYGRTPNLDLMKPNPYCLEEAIKAMGAVPSATLMIGNAATDLEAARQAGVSFLGYARNAHIGQRLEEAGAEFIVDSMQQVLNALRSLP
ncbi:HAD family hydrolase [Streptomyces canus]|uniref:HAD family hydrolase n=1 Tax=Streptomyces canus TaxID=58343 RepID=UPI00371C82BC